MEPRLNLWTGLILFILVSAAVSSDSDLDLNFCGTWRHGSRPLSLNYDLSPGCEKILISADENSLSIAGKITARCLRSGVLNLSQYILDSEENSHFCVYWEPLQDQLTLKLGGQNLTLCWPTGRPHLCCTHLSNGQNRPDAHYGIANGMANNDIFTEKTRMAYEFDGNSVICESLCQRENLGSTQVNMTHDSMTGSQAVGNVNCPCAVTTKVEMKDGFMGVNITANKDVPPDSTTTVHLPPDLKPAAKNNSEVVCTFYKDNALFEVAQKDATILNVVVEINIEHTVIRDLPEPIRIDFQHNAIPETHSRTCVSWDTRRDPMMVTWLVEGCRTQQRGAEHTECLCNHLTYFTVLVRLEPGPVRHLLALTAITSLGCAVSVISCIALIIFLCRKRQSKEPSTPIHLGLAVSLLILYLLFFFTGVLANTTGEGVCVLMGASLHYALLSALTWMGIEVFHTFWMVCMVFTPSPKAYIWNLVGFFLPAVPVIVLTAVGDIYGKLEVEQGEFDADSYKMCWMKNNTKSLLAHYLTNMTILVLLVSAGFVMLFLVYKKIRTRNEWRQNRVAFLSIWGLSCLFGTSWGLAFLSFRPLADVILFLVCILTSFQGFFLMLRFYMLDWMRKQANGFSHGSTSSGSSRSHMLQAQEKT